MNSELRIKLFAIYQKAADYINNAEPESTQLDIINEAAAVVVDNLEELEEAPDVQHILGKCLLYINKDFEDGVNPTLEEYIDMGYELVEELSGFLGAFFE